MIREIVVDLRQLAEKCIRFARSSRTCRVSHVLEELGVDLMAKAKEIEQKLEQ